MVNRSKCALGSILSAHEQLKTLWLVKGRTEEEWQTKRLILQKAYNETEESY